MRAARHEVIQVDDLEETGEGYAGGLPRQTTSPRNCPDLRTPRQPSAEGLEPCGHAVVTGDLSSHQLLATMRDRHPFGIIHPKWALVVGGLPNAGQVDFRVTSRISDRTLHLTMIRRAGRPSLAQSGFLVARRQT